MSHPEVAPLQIDHPENHEPSSSATSSRPPMSPGRRSITLNSPSMDTVDRSAAKTRASAELSDLLNSVEFVPPAEGTPAALALAANAAIKVTKFDKGLHKFRGLKRPKMKSLNLVKKLNKMTKQRRSKRHFSKNFKGKVIDGVHELYTLTAGMMLGIRFSLVRGYDNEAYSDNLAKHEDFEEIENVAFPPKGSTVPPYITPPHSLAHTFKFKSYCPKIFKQLREFFDIDPVDYMNSVCGDYNYLEFISNSKSGQFFFYSHDGKYMLKTQTKEENKFLKQILPQYYRYLKENPHSLLVRILGMHRIKMYHLRRKVHFVIMSSVFDTAAQINTIYDLKGSLVGRSATEKERASGGVLKDCDMLNDHRKLHLGSKKASFMHQLNNDARFLSSLKVMDYSLLVGIHDRRTRTTEYTTIPVPPAMDSTVKGANDSAAGNNSVTTATTNTDKHLTPITATHSNTPFRRSIHEGMLPPVPTSRRASYQQQQHQSGTSKPLSLEDSHTTATTSDLLDPHIHFHDIYRHNRAADHPVTSDDTKDSTTHDPREEPSPATRSDSSHGIHIAKSASFDRNDVSGIAMPPVRRKSSRSYANNNQPLTTSTSTPIAARGSVTDQTANQTVLESEIILSGHLDDGSDNNDEGDDDFDFEGDYDDLDDGDSDVSQDFTLETNPAVANAPSTPPNANRRPSLTAVEEEAEDAKIDENLARIDRSMKFESRFEIVYGNGITTHRPWTSRRDLGINAHTHRGKRGNEIYFVGIIDILQEYNASKRMETMMKGLTNDSRYISSVDPVAYARRFVKFMDANID